ncbi:MAG: SH3 domain-containing protein [Crocinitomicaceae bacterium]|nr:SH3 domain-containing protein [Crocinitomicaceae bacterium]
MKKVLIFLTLIPTIFFAQEDTRYLYYDYEFQEGSTQLLYGNNVVLRSRDDSNSKALDTLRIGDPVEILKKSETRMHLNGKLWNWYKVKAGKKIGYVLGGLIALDHQEVNGKNYLIIKTTRDDKDFARIRVMSKDKSYYGHEIELSTSVISLNVSDGKGLKNVEDMCVISMHAEACGVVGGEVYLFNNGDQLKEVFRTEHVSDAGVFWFEENLEFKDKDYWESNVVFYSREQGEYMDESLDWTKAVVNEVKLTWDGVKFSPDVSKLNFDISK